MSEAATNEAPATIIIHTRQPRVNTTWGPELTFPRGSVNSRPIALVWGEAMSVPVPPGRYEVAVWYQSASYPRNGYATTIVDLEPAAAAQIRWTPSSFLSKGSMEASPVDLRERRDDGPDPAWLGDPTGRHHFRWWDGTGWSDRVNDDGVSSVDPV